jgi:hypothetical protein
VEITTAYPAGSIGDTKANLEAAADGEKMEWSDIYTDFEKTDRKEGFAEITTSFKEMLRWRNSTKNGMANWRRTWSMARCSRKRTPLNGTAPTVIIFMKVRKPLKNAWLVNMPKHIMNF